MNGRIMAFVVAAGTNVQSLPANAEDIYALYFPEQDKSGGVVVYPCLQQSDIPEAFLNGRFKIDRQERSADEAVGMFIKFPKMFILLTNSSCVDQVRGELINFGHDPAIFDFVPVS